MRKTVSLMLLAVVSGNVAAEWVEVNSNADQTVYANLTSRRKIVDTETKNEGIVTMWVLMDYKTVQKNSTSQYLSAKVRIDFNCAEWKRRTTFYSNYSKNMARSNPLDITFSPSDWVTVLSDDADEALYKIACEGNIIAPLEVQAVTPSPRTTTPEPPATKMQSR